MLEFIIGSARMDDHGETFHPRNWKNVGVSIFPTLCTLVGKLREVIWKLLISLFSYVAHLLPQNIGTFEMHYNKKDLITCAALLAEGAGIVGSFWVIQARFWANSGN